MMGLSMSFKQHKLRIRYVLAVREIFFTYGEAKKTIRGFVKQMQGNGMEGNCNAVKSRNRRQFKERQKRKQIRQQSKIRKEKNRTGKRREGREKRKSMQRNGRGKIKKKWKMNVKRSEGNGRSGKTIKGRQQ